MLRDSAESVDTTQCHLDFRRLAPGSSLERVGDTNLQVPNIDPLVISSRAAAAGTPLCSPVRGIILVNIATTASVTIPTRASTMGYVVLWKADTPELIRRMRQMNDAQ